MNIHVDISEAKTGIEQLGTRARQAAERALKDTVVLIANDAIKGSPVETGNNRRSIQFEARGLSGSIYSTSGYGGYLETGTRFMAARPYFRPALDRNFPRFPELMERYLKWSTPTL